MSPIIVNVPDPLSSHISCGIDRCRDRSNHSYPRYLDDTEERAPLPPTDIDGNVLDYGHRLGILSFPSRLKRRSEE
jgi:hypothetical protein